MTAYVLDTNLAVVANNRSSQADDACVLACISELHNIIASGMIVLDTGGAILKEYMNNLSLSGQPGAGDYFMKWVFNVHQDAHRCEQVVLTPRPMHPDDYEEFPQDTALANFDASDRKFVAVALKSQHEPIILNAVDSDWAHHHAALAKHGVIVKFLCPQHCTPPP